MKFSLFKELNQLNESGVVKRDLTKYDNQYLKGFIDALLKGEKIPLSSAIDGKHYAKITKYKKSDPLIKFLQSDEFATSKKPIKVKTSVGEISLGKFLKTPLFGGQGVPEDKKGEDVGKVSVAAQESAAAIGFAIAKVLRKKKLKETDLTEENIEKAKKFFDVNAEKEAVTILTKNPMWQKSVIGSVNSMLAKIPLPGMNFHRDSSIVNDIMSQFNKVKGTAGQMLAKDKWNPADIWAVKGKLKIPTFDNIVELNAWIQKMIDEKKLVGISLKKNAGKATVKTFNNNKEIADLLKIDSVDLILNRAGKLFSSADTYIVYEGIEEKLRDIFYGQLTEKTSQVQFRSFSVDKKEPIQGEIKGKFANQGKIGHGAINRILTFLSLKPVTNKAELEKKLKKKDGKKKMMNAIIKMATGIDSSLGKQAKKSLPDLIDKLSDGKIIAKYQSVEVLDRMKHANEDKKEEFIQRAIAYATSQTEDSSVFVKVG